MTKYVVTTVNKILMGFYIEDGHIQEIHCYEESSLVGNIYIGRVSNILDNINAAFIDIKRDCSCYLSLEDYKSIKPLKIGDELMVQVSKDAIKSKKATVTTNISLTGQSIIIQSEQQLGVSSKIKNDARRNELKALYKSLGCKYGAIIRTRAENISENELSDEIYLLANELDEIYEKSRYATLYSCLYKKEQAYISNIKDMLSRDVEVVTDNGQIYRECGNAIRLYEDRDISISSLYDINHTLDKLKNKNAYLKSGAYLVIEPTEAMTVIDVNSGKAIKGKNTEDIIFKINLEAAKEIARQLRLRNLSGIIMVDFISMKSAENNRKLLEALRACTEADSVSVNVVDMTSLGIIELTRKKVRRPLHEVLK